MAWHSSQGEHPCRDKSIIPISYFLKERVLDPLSLPSANMTGQVIQWIFCVGGRGTSLGWLLSISCHSSGVSGSFLRRRPGKLQAHVNSVLIKAFFQLLAFHISFLRCGIEFHMICIDKMRKTMFVPVSYVIVE